MHLKTIVGQLEKRRDQFQRDVTSLTAAINALKRGGIGGKRRGRPPGPAKKKKAATV